ncbi:hypothetical protein [Paramagnetospirillum magnetotacticum]|uniref:hypothetical protein n=1 Tax=Paramagnetospirillum magnetotacticum TaxID=188 RepID=UPI0005979444|nr:hypothetical protein [Paramagnetospirillum magnetotacticum]
MAKLNKVNLTQRMVDTLKIPEEGESLIMDEKVPGLGVRIRDTGKASLLPQQEAVAVHHCAV